MKKNLALLLALMLCFTLFAACTSSENSDDGNITDSGETAEDTSAERVSLILGLDASFPPMGYTDEGGEIIGFDIDVAKAVCEKLGWELILQPIDWDAKELELNSGSIDCIWNGMTKTDERDAAMSLSVPYLNNEQVVVVKADSGITTLAELAGKSLILQAGSSAEDALNGADEFRASLGSVNTIGDNMLAFMDVEQGTSDAILLDSIVANWYITQNGGASAWTVIEEALATEEYAIGFRKEDTALTELVNKTLSELKADGTIESISTDWFGADVTIIR
ncbi:MAG: amino acid ABC transporter substrate-binding protein [Oscillospiraceae bacterium]|jgi:polar amino acid transport system substrate-binding protein|nr:amino acid ABC transporter substrate-binding protein [Oscillospiraceae bacterium]